MQAPSLPQNEIQRLQALQERGLLDTPPEERFDRITRLAQHMFGVPFALISLVDAKRQWFKSCQGLQASETGRDVSFCGHAILGADIFHVADARLDPRFADNPLVTGPPHIRFYAGAPLKTSRGLRIGTLCIIDDKPRQLSTRELRALRDLADCAEEQINRIQVEHERQLLKQAQQLEILARAQLQFIRETDRHRAFDGLLSDILNLTESDYGFLGEVRHTAAGDPYLKTYAISNITWDDDTRAFYQNNAPQDAEFFNLNSLFGAALSSGEPVIANDPAHDPRRGGLPEGHPPLNAFLGVPVHHGGELVAMLGIANRPEGYDQQLLDFLQPLLATLGQLTVAARVQQQHQDGEQRLRAIIEGTNIGTWEWNVQTGTTVFNERWAEMVGCSLAELEPISIQTWMDLAHPDDLEKSNAALQAHFAGELDYYDVQCRMRHKDGHWIWVHDRGRVVSWTEDGKPLLMSGTHADITQRKQAETALRDQAEQTQAVVDNMVDGIITINQDGMVDSFNPAAERIFGYLAAEVLGRNIKMLMPAPHRDAHDSYLRDYQATGMARIIGIGREVEGQRKDGSLFPMELAVSEITRQERPMYVGMVRDITERKRAERMKSEFVSTVSHELRTPLTAIGGALGLVSGGAFGELPAQAQHMVDIARKNGERLTHLINDLLDIEKLAAGKMPFDMQVQTLMPLIDQALEANRGYGAEHQVNLTLTSSQDDVQVSVDGQRFMQVMSNLLSNAIKYSPPQDTVEIAMERCGKSVRVTVSDHGPGVPEAFRDRVFEKFVQADSSDTRQKGGTGLGLAITKELVERMGGRIGFDSTPGRGATFFFELPLWDENAAASLFEAHTPQALDAARILVVEDEADVARMLGLILSRAGYKVDIAGSGKEALAALKNQRYAAVTLDLLLPDISGLEIIRRLRQHADTAELPVVVISAKMEDGRLAINGDFTNLSWLAKPIDESHLLTILAGLVAPSSQRPRLLHVEDDTNLLQVVRSMAGPEFEFARAATLAQARTRLALDRFDVVILDLVLPDGSGWDLLPEIRRQLPGARIVILSGYDVTSEDTQRVDAVLTKSKVSPRQLLDAIRSHIHPAAQQ